MKKYISLLILALSVIPGLALAQSLSVAEQEKIDGLVNKFMEASHVPGMAVSMAKSGQLYFLKVMDGQILNNRLLLIRHKPSSGLPVFLNR